MVGKLMNLGTQNCYSKKMFLAGIAICFSTHLAGEISVSANLLLGRSFSANIAREMLMTGPINPHNNDNINGFFAIDGAYQKAWNQSKIEGVGAYPLWSKTNSMSVGTSDGLSNVDAYQFGLGNVTTIGTIKLNPVIGQTGSDFMFYIQSKQYGHSIFAKTKSALSLMKANPVLTETNAVTPVSYPAGAITSLSGTGPFSTTADPSSSMVQAFAGNTGTQSVQGDFKPMTNGLINGTQSTGAHLSDTEMTIGYNYTCDESNNSVSLGLRVTAPTGNKSKSVYILEPINGRDGAWGIGYYLAGNYHLWNSDSKDNSLQFNFMSNGIHLCKHNVMRSYDLTANGHGSKYLLVADYQNGVYQNSIQNLVNLSTLESQSSFAFEGDAALALNYATGGLSMDLGYNVWGRTKERLTITESFDSDRYAILGRQVVANSTTGNASTLCQPTATINTSLATAGGDGNTNSNGTTIVPATISTNRIGGSEAFNTTIAGQYAAVTSKIFAKVGYNWKNSDCSPYLNLIGECEWSNISNNALPQWGITLAGGISL